jgi:hypothetical protein
MGRAANSKNGRNRCAYPSDERIALISVACGSYPTSHASQKAMNEALDSQLWDKAL